MNRSGSHTPTKTVPFCSDIKSDIKKGHFLQIPVHDMLYGTLCTRPHATDPTITIIPILLECF